MKKNIEVPNSCKVGEAFFSLFLADSKYNKNLLGLFLQLLSSNVQPHLPAAYNWN